MVFLLAPLNYVTRRRDDYLCGWGQYGLDPVSHLLHCAWDIDRYRVNPTIDRLRKGMHDDNSNDAFEYSMKTSRA